MYSSCLIRDTWFSVLLAVGFFAGITLPLPGQTKTSGQPVSNGSIVASERLDTLLESAKSDLLPHIPRPGQQSMEAYTAADLAVKTARAALDEGSKNLAEIRKAEGLVDHAQQKWIGGAAKEVHKASLRSKQAKTDEQRSAAVADVLKWQKNRLEGISALSQRKAALSTLKAKEAGLKHQVGVADLALSKAHQEMTRVISEMNLGPALENGTHDERLARYVVLKHMRAAKPGAFPAKSPEDAALFEQMLDDGPLLVRMLVADGAKDGNYGQAFRIYREILNASERAKEGHFNRLALALALEHATPLRQRNTTTIKGSKRQNVDPVKRYLHFEKAFLTGKLDPEFKELTEWDYRFVVNAEEPDEILQWGRDMLRTYRPDLVRGGDKEPFRYTELINSDIHWSTAEYKNDRSASPFVQSIFMNGGTCGRRAFMGRFLLRSHGVPTVPRPQIQHASLVQWTPDGWETRLGAAWGKGLTMTPYKEDLNFQAATQARAASVAFMKVMRAHWIGEVMGESRTWGLLGSVPEFWNGVALYTQRHINEQLAEAKKAAEKNHPADEQANIRPFIMTDDKKKIVIGNDGYITVPAVAVTRTGLQEEKVIFMEGHDGGTLIHCLRSLQPQELEYLIHVPLAGSYDLVAKIATPGIGQNLAITANSSEKITIPLPHTLGLWGTTQPARIDLIAGQNILRILPSYEEFPKGLTIREFTLSPIR